MEQNKNELGSELENAQERFKANNTAETVEKFGSFVNRLAKDRVAGDAFKVGDTAPDFILRNAVGKEISLKEELANGPVILTWYRGGWCPYCNLALNFLQRHLPEFRSYGAQLLAITPETPDQSMSTKEKHNLEFEALTDESNVVALQYGGYTTYQMKSVIFMQNVASGIITGIIKMLNFLFRRLILLISQA